MHYPIGKDGELDKDKLQKIFLAATPFNMIFAEYFKVRGDTRLHKYINSLVVSYINENNITAETLIEQIENTYQAYLLDSSEASEDGTN